MKIKLLRAPHHGQKDIVCNTPMGTFAMDVGDELEVPEETGHHIMGRWPGCFQMVAAEKKTQEPLPAEPKVQEPETESEPAPVEKREKIMAGYQNKRA